MYVTLIKMGRFFKNLSPVVTAAVAFLLAISYLALTMLGMNEQYDLYYKILTIVPAVSFLIWAAAKFLTRRSQLKSRDFKYVTKLFRTPEEFARIFDQSIDIGKGRLKLLKKLEERQNYKWPENERDMGRVSSINAAAFRGTPWAGGADEKLTRNLAMWRKNPRSFLMILDDNQGDEPENQAVFFSHILPLSDHGYHHYFETAESGDNEFDPDWMAEAGQPLKGLLLFTIARDPDHETAEKGQSEKQLPNYLYAVAYHIQAILDHYPDQKYTTLYFQNSEKKFKRLAGLSGFKQSRLVTHDEETVYVVSVDNCLCEK
ncbi:MAG: hypothetical protein COA93_01480 [Alphaproteobacteria bacterium]|nr:MAG: hypothetical protein COA93_01480 [Alphaproteobacteria bacterium]